MNKLKRILVILVSCFMLMASLTTSVSAKPGRGEKNPVKETVEAETPDETITEEVSSEDASEEELADEAQADETVIEEAETEPEALESEEQAEKTELAFEPQLQQVEFVPVLGETYETKAEGNDDTSLNPLGTGKTLTYNNDGTYTLALSVTGDSQSSSETTTSSANVLIIYDVSNSMTGNRSQNDLGSMGVDTSQDGSEQGSEGAYFQLYKSRSTSDALAEGEEYSGTLYRYNNGWSVYDGKRYSTARRADAAEKALYDMVTDIADGDVQFSLITFSSSASTSVDWTTNASSITNKLSSEGTYGTAKLTYSRGTGWANALNQGLTQLGKADSDPTYVIFITDGRPSDTTLSNSYTYARRINTYNTADHTYSNPSASNTVLYGIYAYGLQEDYLDDVVYYAKNGTQRTASIVTNTDGIEDQYFRAGSTQALQDAIETIKQNIKNSLNYGGVSYEDGIATDTTNTTLTTDVDGDVSGLTYTVTQGTETKYTVTTDGSDVTFTISGTNYDGVKGTYTIDETSYDYYYAVDSDGNPLTFTVGSGDTAQTYQYKMGLASFEGGSLDWDLTGIGGLVGGYTYTLSFTVWPVQGAYDAVADLNNGLAKWDTTLDTYEDLTSTRGYEKGGVIDYPNIVKYSNGAYAVLTNTSQEVTYYVVETEEVDGVATTTYDGPYTTTPTSPSPMSLVGSNIDIVKEWLVSLSPGELEDWVNKGNTLKLRLKSDNNTYIDYVFPDEQGMTDNTDEFGNVLWTKTASIAPGIMLTKTKAAAAGIDTTKYKTVSMDGTEYVLLGEGHDYTVEEVDGSDPHFEFSTDTYHPMLVDGVLKNIEFSTDKTMATVKDANLTEIKGTNKLKGGISIYKEVFNADMKTQVTDCEDEFAFKVTLWAEDSTGAKSPVYTTEDQFDNGVPVSGSFGYRVYEDTEEGTETKQRDAIYSGTSPAKVTVGEEVTEMIFSMQANQYCYIVNVPAGTKYTIEELQGDGYNHFYSSVSVLAGDDTTGTYEVIEEKELEGDALALTDHSVDGYVSANSSSKAVFRNWAGSFYVYHSSDNTIEKIAFTDERVTGKYTEAGYKYAFNIAEETKEDNLYGGYYKAYAGASMTTQQIINATYAAPEEASAYAYKADTAGGSWTKDTDGTAYTGALVNQWSNGETESGLAANVKANTVYFVKEVPDSKYLQPYTHYTYYKAAPQYIANLWMISDIDDLNYTETGFIITTNNDKAKVCKSLTVQNQVGGAKVKLTPNNVFRKKGVVATNYLTYCQEDGSVSTPEAGKGTSDLRSGQANVTMYWITPDNVFVTSAVKRNLTGDGKKSGLKATDDTDFASTIKDASASSASSEGE